MHPLRRKRREAILTMQELSERAGVSEWTILKIEKGFTTDPHPRTIRQLAAALGCEPLEIMALEPQEAEGGRR